MRLTRAALRAEATQHDETADASSPSTDARERIPLGEVSANATTEPALSEDANVQKMPAKKTKAKGGAKKGKKAKAVEDEHVDMDQVLEDERQVAGSPASDAALDELAKGPTDDVVQVPMNDTRPASPPSRAVRMTRRQLAKQEEELSKSQRLPSPPSQPQPAAEDIHDVPSAEQRAIDSKLEEPVAGPGGEEAVETQEPEPAEAVQVQEPGLGVPGGEEAPEAPAPEVEETTPEAEETAEIHAPEAIAPEVSITSEHEPKTLTSEKPCDEEATPATSRTPSRAPSRSPSKSPMRIEESIEAIDALEEALENVGKAIPLFDTSADEKSPRKTHFDVDPATTPNTRARKGNAVKISPLASKLSSNPSAPTSLKPTAARSSISRSASTRSASSKDARKGSGEVVDYLASKRRPISMSFPVPPPPPKSSKPPTKSTFQLPGEAVAAKLKALKEERLRREEAGEGAAKQPRPVSMPPPPKSTKPPTKPNFQLPGEAVAAKLKAQKEERLKREEEEAAKRPAFKARPAPARKNVSVPVRQTAASKARESVMTKENTTTSVTIPPLPKRTSSINKRNSAVVSRPAFNLSTSSASSSNRNSLNLNAGLVNGKSTVSAADAAAQRLKAREIFNRDKLEKEAREKERHEKEEAARRARAEAAERGRIASREWAEKQKKKVLSGALKTETA